MKKILPLMMAMLLMLSGCSQITDLFKKTETETTVCRKTTDSGDENIDTFVTEVGEDKVLTDTMVYVIDYTSRVESGDYTMDEIDEYFAELKEEYKDEAGMTYDYRIEGNKVYESIFFDYDVVDFAVLVELDFLTTSKNITWISLSSTIDNLEEIGYTCELE